MGRTCGLCQGPASKDSCFVRVGRDERPACRPCWEQLVLDPRRLVQSLKGAPDSPPQPPAGTQN